MNTGLELLGAANFEGLASETVPVRWPSAVPANVLPEVASDNGCKKQQSGTIYWVLALKSHACMHNDKLNQT